MTGEPFSKRRCPACGRMFGSPRARAMHERDNHTPKALARKANQRAAAARARQEDSEPSYADRLIDAQLAVAMGDPVGDPEIEAMFGDYLYDD